MNENKNKKGMKIERTNEDMNDEHPQEELGNEQRMNKKKINEDNWKGELYSKPVTYFPTDSKPPVLHEWRYKWRRKEQTHMQGRTAWK